MTSYWFYMMKKPFTDVIIPLVSRALPSAERRYKRKNTRHTEIEPPAVLEQKKREATRKHARALFSRQAILLAFKR